MTAVQKSTKNVGAIHELPLHFLCCTQLKTAIKSAFRETMIFDMEENSVDMRSSLKTCNQTLFSQIYIMHGSVD
ncbi:MAG: hypothetical protein DCF19_20795 [Pseudanabaena frigida]|uniref:Uncharacterized protein n=1 Tax=Pseudanabaena frigida TaxID=945775 RepID=A0A2W4XZI4_9CYAN|nr:MAG: hypothetical protein DCF19_20795 [Pseudanabaena frigida]